MTIDPRAATADGRSVAGRPFPLPSLAVIDVHGTDAATFLQGQLSNDLIGGGTGGGAGRACLAGYCNPKGRLLALPLVLTLPEGALRLLVSHDLADAFVQRLRMFVLRADVTFESREGHSCHGLLVPTEQAEDEPLRHGVAALPPNPPASVLDVLGGENGADDAQICRWHDASLPYPCRRYLIVTDSAPRSAAAGGAQATGDARDIGVDGADAEALWRLGDISAGIPRIVSATREAFVPQMVNLQLVGGLSFRKGCYPGQEIVARMQYLGKLKRHMRRFLVTPDAAARAMPTIVPGDALVAGSDGDAGRVVDAVPTAAGTELLAVVKTGTAPEALRLHGAPIVRRSLPYALPEERTGASEEASGNAAQRGEAGAQGA